MYYRLYKYITKCDYSRVTGSFEVLSIWGGNYVQR